MIGCRSQRGFRSSSDGGDRLRVSDEGGRGCSSNDSIVMINILNIQINTKIFLKVLYIKSLCM